MRSKGQRSRSLGTKMWKSLSAHIFAKSGSIYIKLREIFKGRFYTHIVNTFHQRKRFVFVTFVCNFPVSRAAYVAHSGHLDVQQLVNLNCFFAVGLSEINVFPRFLTAGGRASFRIAT